VSGWWGVARHFHYVPEILGAVCWTLPALFTHFLPWFYVVFLTLLLLDRIYRDDTRCRAKYGKFWDAYCEKVPYSLIPFVF
jgi:7-dehydrocholesterol reductase